MMFDYAAHCRALSSDPEVVARRSAAIRAALRWTPEMDAKLIEMHSQRRGIIPIAAAIGVAKSVVRRRRDELGLPALRRGEAGFRRPDRTIRQAPGVVTVKVIS